jgi:hypothetical protein
VSASSPQPAAREEFLLEAARLARRRLAPGAEGETEDGDDTEPEDGEAAPDWRQDISDPASGLSRLLSEWCATCILRRGDPMHLGPERTAAFIRQVLDAGSYVVCHDTLTYGDFPDYGPAAVKTESSRREDKRGCNLRGAPEQHGLLFSRPGAMR